MTATTSFKTLVTLVQDSQAPMALVDTRTSKIIDHNLSFSSLLKMDSAQLNGTLFISLLHTSEQRIWGDVIKDENAFRSYYNVELKPGLPTKKIKFKTLPMKTEEHSCHLLFVKECHLDEGVSFSYLELKKILEESPVISIGWYGGNDRNTGARIRSVSSTVSRLGFHPEDFYQNKLNFLKMVIPEYRDSLKKGFVDLVTGKIQDFQGEFKFRMPNGKSAWFMVNTSYVETLGDSRYFQTLLFDITRIKKLEKRYDLQKSMLYTILDTLPFSAYIIDPRTYRITYGNVLSGYQRDSLNKTCHALTHNQDSPCDGKEHLCPLREVVKTRKACQTQHIHHTESGEERFYNVHGVPLFNKDGELYEVIEYSIDVTPLVKAAEFKDNIREKMLNSEKMASLGLLSAGMCHELKNPLTIISSQMLLLLKQIQKGQFDISNVSEGLERVLRNVRRMTSIINHVREYGRDHRRDADVIVSVNDIVNEAQLLFQKEVVNQGIDLKYTLATDLSLIRCNKVRIESVIQNLILNARDAFETITDDRDKFIEIKTLNVNKQVIEVQVIDNASGIPRDKVEVIFEAFFTTKEVGKGTGLGLSLVHDIVKEHNGDISVISEEGKGTTFFVRLPRHKEK